MIIGGDNSGTHNQIDDSHIPSCNRKTSEWSMVKPSKVFLLLQILNEEHLDVVAMIAGDGPMSELCGAAGVAGWAGCTA